MPDDIDPRMLEIYRTMIEKGKSPIIGPNLLDYLIKIRREPGAVQIGPGKIPEAIQKLAIRGAFLPAHVAQGTYNLISNLLNRIDISPMGTMRIAMPKPPTPPVEVPPSQRLMQWQAARALAEAASQLSQQAPPRQLLSQKLQAQQPQEQPSAPTEVTDEFLAQEAQPMPKPTVPVQPAAQQVEPTQPPVTDETWMQKMKEIATPWKPQTDFEKELYNLFDELTKAYSKKIPENLGEPKSIMDVLAQFAQNLGLIRLGKDPFEFRQRQTEAEWKKAKMERDEAIGLATQIFNAKLTALTNKIQQEEQERQRRLAYLDNLTKLYPTLAKQPEYLAALSSIYGIPESQTLDIIRRHTDPKTGQLVGLHKTPVELEVEKWDAILKAKEKALRDAGLSEEDARYAAIFGAPKDPEKAALDAYRRTLETNDPVKIKEARDRYLMIRQAMKTDPERDIAVYFISEYQKDPLGVRKKLASLFNNPKALNSFISHMAAKAYGLDVEKWKFPEDKELSFNEAKVREASEVLKRNNPKEIQEFMQSTGGLHPSEVVRYSIVKSDKSPIATEEPFYTLQTIFGREKLNVDQVASSVMPGNPVGQMVDEAIYNRYKATFDVINSKLPQKAPLTQREMYKIASLLNAGKEEEAMQLVQQLWAGKREK